MQAIPQRLTKHEIVAVRIVLNPPKEVGPVHGRSNLEESRSFGSGANGAAP
jgi:hypothetical protein